MNCNKIVNHAVVDGLREAFRQQPMKTAKLFLVNARVEGKRVNV